MNNKAKKIFLIIMIIIFSIGILYGCYKVFIWKNDNEIVDDINKDINESIEVEIVEEKKEYKVDFKKLKKINPDTVAYLKVNNTLIDYAVVKGSDNSYYLKHNFKKKTSKTGWIFASYRNKFDGSDKNIVIFGHNMQSGKMFGTLKNILNEDWYTNEENRYVTLITEDGNHIYEVFSVYTVKAEDYYINTYFANNINFYYFLNEIKKRSIYDFGVKLNKNDKILTLSTCRSGSTYRTVLHAKKIK